MDKNPKLLKQDRPREIGRTLVSSSEFATTNLVPPQPEAPSGPKPQDKPQKFDMWSKLRGTQVVIQEKGGILITGLFTKIENGFLKIKNAEITSREKRVCVDRIWVDRSAIAHIHQNPTSVEIK